MSFPATLSTDASGAAVSPANGAASATASDATVPADDSSNVSCSSALSTDASEKTVSPVNGAASATASDDAVPADDSSNVSYPSALSTDASEITVSPVNGAAAGTAADATPIDDVGVFVTPFDDTAGKTLVPVTASAAGAVAANATAVGSDCYGPSDREKIDISIFLDRRHFSSGCCCCACRAGGKTWKLR